MRRLTRSRLVAGALVVVLASATTAGAADQGSQSAPGVPDDFSPAAMSWVSASQGWVLGYVPCGEGSCAQVLHTTTGGSSWGALAAPGLNPSEFGNSSQLQVTQTRWVTTLVATNSEDTVISTTGGESWQPVDVPADKVGDLAGTSEGVYLTAHTTEGEQVTTTLWRSPNTGSAWESVEGVSAEVPSQLGSVMSDIAVGPGGVRLVGSAAFGAPTHAWSSPDGAEFEEIEAPCSDLATQFFGLADEEHQFALCSQNPGQGAMDKELFLSSDGVRFESVGTVPPRNGITSDFAVVNGDTVAIGATAGDAGIVYMTFDGGQTWDTPLIAEDTGPVLDLSFQDQDHGTLLAGYPDLGTSVIYRTSDGGHTWEPLDL